jgi:Lytic transglycolase
MSSEGWSFTAEVDGDDIVVNNTTATWFGGDNDPLDNGETASGVMTKGNPNVLGCALPVVPSHPSTAGSPLAFSPRIPWKTKVVVESEGKSLTVDLIDNGPAKSARDAIDLTPAAFEFFAPIEKGVIKVSFRILGAAKFIPKTV